MQGQSWRTVMKTIVIEFLHRKKKKKTKCGMCLYVGVFNIFFTYLTSGIETWPPLHLHPSYTELYINALSIINIWLKFILPKEMWERNIIQSNNNNHYSERAIWARYNNYTNMSKIPAFWERYLISTNQDQAKSQYYVLSLHGV